MISQKWTFSQKANTVETSQLELSTDQRSYRVLRVMEFLLREGLVVFVRVTRVMVFRVMEFPP